VSSLQHHLAAPPTPTASRAAKENFDEILKTFEEVQERHARARQEAISSRSLKHEDK
jgi:hypothetical protein